MYTCMTQCCNTTHAEFLWTVTKISTVLVVKSRKTNKQDSEATGKGCKFICFRA